MRGIFITVEGGEGAGKSTQSKLLANHLEQSGRVVTLTREPGGTHGAEQLRALLVTGNANRWSPISEALLMYAARADHWQKLIEPALANGHVVICDRFADSSVAYQGYGHGVSLDFFDSLYKNVIGTRKPDRTYVFDLDPGVGLERSCKRLAAESARESVKEGAENRFESLDVSFHQRVRQGFMQIAEREPKRCRVIDATSAPEIIEQIIWHDIMGIVDRGIL
ncbi:MAG: dTMP kinase [Alphaproteobacteria bacterium]|nr:dTMP kinase [Alphaproteobacteria bacterium]